MYQRFLKTSRLLTLAVGVSTSLLAFTLAQAAELKWAAQNDILTLDPHSQNHATTNNIVGHAYEGLVRYDKNYKVEPSLASASRHHEHLCVGCEGNEKNRRPHLGRDFGQTQPHVDEQLHDFLHHEQIMVDQKQV